ncbi:MAG: GAF domain-containing protein, partial [Nitrospiraceae bacterium]
MNAPVPATEAERLDALRRYAILDTPPEQNFDELVSLASQICRTPIAAISLIDADRQWFKAKVGLTSTQTPRAIAFCAHAIVQPDLFVVRDAMADPRFSTNPLVTADPHIRFYAGMPLIASNGHALGTLCVIDRVPRELTQEQAEALRA